MRAILRWKAVLLAGGLWLGPASAFAQDSTPASTTNAPAPATIGPSELQNFSLSGNVTKPAEQQAPASIAAPRASASSQSATIARPPIRRSVQDRPESRETANAAPIRAPAAAAPQPSAPLQPSVEAAAPPSVQPAYAPAVASEPMAPADNLTPGRKTSFLPWLAAALALAGGMIFLLRRRRPREVLAGAPELDLYVAPEPAAAPEPAELPPAPPPTPAPPRRAAPAANGIVASRLRPSLELGVQPLRCLVEDEQITIEFEVELFNAGTAPARAVLAEASMLNASATQDQELAAFFANPVGTGERLDAIPPMRRISLTSKVVAPRDAIREYELAGHKAFVPLLAFNALYEWSGGKAQTSAAYLVGRETKSDKLGPLRLESAPRAFGSLAARELPTGLKT